MLTLYFFLLFVNDLRNIRTYPVKIEGCKIAGHLYDIIHKTGIFYPLISNNNSMNRNVDLYLLEGCGRCSLYRTPECKVHTWSAELEQLRRIVLDCGLKEDLKWSQPCYTFQKDNVLMVTAFKEYAAIAFFKGSLLKDTHNILIAAGASSQASRQIRFTDAQKITNMKVILKTYIYEAIEIEKAGLKVKFKKKPEPWPEELIQKFEVDPTFKSAFEALTPGRQRGYIIHFSQPKQSKTRTSRIDKYMDKILKGKGFFD